MRLQAYGPHFFLVNVKEDASVDGCPPNVALDSSKGEKWKSVMMPEDADNLPMVEMESATLGEILEAEQAAEPLRDSEYDLTRNSCVRYGIRIWRQLGFKETHEMASFIVDNLVGSEYFQTIIKNHVASGGFSAYLAHFMGKSAFKSYFTYVVYRELDVVDEL